MLLTALIWGSTFCRDKAWQWPMSALFVYRVALHPRAWRYCLLVLLPARRAKSASGRFTAPWLLGSCAWG